MGDCEGALDPSPNTYPDTVLRDALRVCAKVCRNPLGWPKLSVYNANYAADSTL